VRGRVGDLCRWTKLPVGLWLGSTKNTMVVTHLLADLVDQGLDTSGGCCR
jgi:hypothetical protein